jgi:hypothetical protein
MAKVAILKRDILAPLGSTLGLTKYTTMSQRSTLSQVFGLIGWLAIVFMAAAIGAAASADASTFYAQLVRPSWAPPASAFGPVWSVLYLLMGVAAWLVWREQSASHRVAALTLFMVQLCANSLWSWLFFAWRTCVRRDIGSAGSYRRDIGGVLAHPSSGWRSSASVSRMGLPCICTHLVCVARQSQSVVVSRGSREA